jgi:hypothetical protein
VNDAGMPHLSAASDLRVSWPAVGLALFELALIVGVLLVGFSGRLVFVVGANLIAFRSQTYLHEMSCPHAGAGGDDAEASGVREPPPPTGPEPKSGAAQLEPPMS